MPIRRSENRSTFIRGSVRKPGMSPGSLIHVGELKVPFVTMRLIQYNQHNHLDIVCKEPQNVFEHLEPGHIHWLDIYGLHELPKIQQLADHYKLPPMMLEDILDTEQSLKVDNSHEGLLFIIMKMFVLEHEIEKIDLEQVSIVMHDNWVLTFQERPGDGFDPLRARIEKPTGRHRKKNGEYLLFTILDAIMDSYFETLDVISDQIEDVEIDLLHNTRKEHINQIYSLKVELVYLRRAVYPVAEMLNQVERSGQYFNTPNERHYLRELRDSQHQVIERVHTYTEILDSMMDLYHSNLSTRQNQVVTTLTIISAIFIPMTFVASIYGMNFANMPELKGDNSYFYVLGVIVAIGLSMLGLFKFKKWL
jgi:magnesium transporter